nr:hypothetical protein [Streptococcus oralis]
MGYAALNLIEGLSDNIQWCPLEDDLTKGKNPYIYGQVANFRGRPKVDTIELWENLDESDKNQPYILSCHSVLRSYITERIL